MPNQPSSLPSGGGGRPPRPSARSGGGAAAPTTGAGGTVRRGGGERMPTDMPPDVRRPPPFFPGAPGGGHPFGGNLGVAGQGAFVPFAGYNQQQGGPLMPSPFDQVGVGLPRTTPPRYGDEYGAIFPPTYGGPQQGQPPRRNNQQQRPPQPPQPPQRLVPGRAYQEQPEFPPAQLDPPPALARYPVGSLTAPPPRGQPQLEGSTRITQRIKDSGPGGYGALLKDKPPVNTIPPMGIDIGMIEICTFFPSWFQIPDVAMRAIRNDWTRKDIAKAQLYAMNALNKANMKTTENRVQKQISEGGKRYLNLGANERWDSERRIAEMGAEVDLEGHTWGLRDPEATWGHMLLADIATGVVNWPQGEDRLLVTRCIQFAMNNQHLRLDTSHYHHIIQSQGWPYPAPMNDIHDRRAVARLRRNVNDPAT